ncbi:hypothetical protein [Phascolarctobacterium succinatutens]|uniref:hypothetical protein n=1 Tax=Phascolarctobacterium succinatutens TaxID=626940 RepID=UPI0026EDFF85|nr:hypothetical protein [Phascolarctobacterium succinatutens]
MAVNKVIYGGTTLVDLTGDTVTAADLADGVKATNAAGEPIVGLMQKVTIDAELSTTSTNPVQNKVIKTELDKKMAKTDKIYEANLNWGGRNIKDDYSPTDAGMIAELGANRFEFGNIAGVTIEYSEDAGATWSRYSVSDSTLISLFSVASNYVYAGGDKSRLPSANDMLRVTIDVDVFQVYTALNKFALYISTGGANGCYCTIEASLENTPTVFYVFADRVPIGGWSGYNIINTPVMETYNNQPTRQYGLIRFTFGSTSAPTNPDYKGLAVLKIMGFGGVGWLTPSNIAKNGHLYRYNRWQEAIFPSTVTATNFIGNINGYTIGASVPANAKFTDTVYTHPATHPASMITGLASVAKSGSYNDLTDKPTIPASSTVDSELSSTSVNPVQNKVINAALNNKADSSVLSGYLPLTGGTCTGNVSAPSFQTGTGTTNYFQCQKFRGEGDSTSYYHAIDFGYSGHDSVDFYEYDPNWNFYSCTTGKKSQAVLVGNINGNGWNGGAKLTGAPTAPTAATGTNTTQIATTAFVQNSLGSYVKTVNHTAPDENGNVTITVSGGVSLSTENTWTAKQNFQKMKFNFESYSAPRISGATDNPSSSVAVYNVQGNFTLNMSTLAGLLSNGDATVFTAYITSNGAYTLSINNAGTLKYVGSASDLAITANGLLLNIMLIKSSSGVVSSIIQASKLS